MWSATTDFWKHECSVDGKSQLRCEGKHWQLEKSCPGKYGCRRVETRIDRGHESRLMCDELVTDKGAACASEGRHTCASGFKATLRCSGGTWHHDQDCRGPSGCTEGNDGVTCDDTLAALDDPCGDDGSEACAVDKKSRLKCKSHKMVLDKLCKSGCTVVSDRVQKGKPGPAFECE